MNSTQKTLGNFEPLTKLCKLCKKLVDLCKKKRRFYSTSNSSFISDDRKSNKIPNRNINDSISTNIF